MNESENDIELNQIHFKNETAILRSRPRAKEAFYNITSKFPHYFIPKRPKVIKMRDLSPATKALLYKEYYDAYDPWTGIRIAATLGILISLFTLFLTYKSKYNKSRNAVVTSKKASLYIYEEDLDCDLGNVGSSNDTGSFAYSFRYEDKLPGIREYHFGLRNNYPMEEVCVKSSVVECVALTVHNNQKGTKGPKYGTIRITEDATRSLPCSPYNQQKTNKTSNSKTTSSKLETTCEEQCISSALPLTAEKDVSLSGSITSLSSNATDCIPHKNTVFSKSKGKTVYKKESEIKIHKKADSMTGLNEDNDELIESPVPKLTPTISCSKRPQDYRSRSTIVTIGRRNRKS